MVSTKSDCSAAVQFAAAAGVGEMVALIGEVTTAFTTEGVGGVGAGVGGAIKGGKLGSTSEGPVATILGATAAVVVAVGATLGVGVAGTNLLVTAAVGAAALIAGIGSAVFVAAAAGLGVTAILGLVSSVFAARAWAFGPLAAPSDPNAEAGASAADAADWAGSEALCAEANAPEASPLGAIAAMDLSVPLSLPAPPPQALRTVQTVRTLIKGVTRRCLKGG